MPAVRGFTAVLLVVVAACQGSKPGVEGGREVRVAAAADLKFAFEEVKAAFHNRYAGIAVKVTYGSSGNFFAQLSNEAPFDVFLSADIDYPRKLVEMGRAVRDSEFVYAIGRIVVWVPKDSSLDVGKQGMK